MIRSIARNLPRQEIHQSRTRGKRARLREVIVIRNSSSIDITTIIAENLNCHQKSVRNIKNSIAGQNTLTSISRSHSVDPERVEVRGVAIAPEAAVIGSQF